MVVKDHYTTAEKIAADKEGEEEKKISLSNDGYAICEFIDELVRKIEQTRLSLI